MSFKDLTLSRYSVRKYKDKPVDKATLQAVLEAGRLAPTAANKQPQRILAVTSAEGLKKIDAASPCRNGAPAVLVVCYDKTQAFVRPTDNAASGEIDASIVTTSLMYQAAELGLGSLWVMFFDPAKLRAEFAIPENLVPMALLILGYADDAPPPSKPRLPIEKTVSWEKF
jgi:nitroreductase